MIDQPQLPVPSENDYGARPTALPDLNPEDWDQYDGEVREPKRRRLQPYHVTEMGGRPRREYVIKGLLDRGAFAEMYGDTNSGKTFTALDVAEHVAHGWSWRGRKVRGGPVCYIAAEGGLGLEERLTAFRQHHSVDQADVPLYIIPAGIDLCSTDSDAKILELFNLLFSVLYQFFRAGFARGSHR